MARAHDGSGHQLREERDVERVIDDVGDDFLLAAVDIDHVGHALEGVEADAHRQDDVQRERIEWPGHHPRQIAGQEIVVLEEAEKTEVGGQAHHQRGLAFASGGKTPHPHGGRVIDGREGDDQQHELRVPTHVKEIAGGKQNPAAGWAGQRIEQHQHHHEEREELRGMEEHQRAPCAGASRRPISPASIMENS